MVLSASNNYSKSNVDLLSKSDDKEIKLKKLIQHGQIQIMLEMLLDMKEE